MDDVEALRERAKELRCLYRINAVVSDRSRAPSETFLRVLELIPAGWRLPDETGARIEYLGQAYVGPGFTRGGPSMSEPLRLWRTEVGLIEVTTAAQEGEGAAFLPEEFELLRSIAQRLGDYLEWKHTQLMSARAPGADHEGWRERYARALAAALDPERFGVARLFLGGSVGTGQAGSGSDLDLYLDFRGDADQRRDLTHWLEGWSRCLGELAQHQTGYRFPDGFLDLHWLEDPDPRLLIDKIPLTLGP